MNWMKPKFWRAKCCCLWCLYDDKKIFFLIFFVMSFTPEMSHVGVWCFSHELPIHCALNDSLCQWRVELQIMPINFTRNVHSRGKPTHNTHRAPRHHHCSWDICLSFLILCDFLLQSLSRARKVVRKAVHRVCSPICNYKIISPPPPPLHHSPRSSLLGFQ